MTLASHLRTALFTGGLGSIALSIALDGLFATDATVPVPMPPSLALLATAGVAAIAASLIRRRKK